MLEPTRKCPCSWGICVLSSEPPFACDTISRQLNLARPVRLSYLVQKVLDRRRTRNCLASFLKPRRLPIGGSATSQCGLGKGALASSPGNAADLKKGCETNCRLPTRDTEASE